MSRRPTSIDGLPTPAELRSFAEQVVEWTLRDYETLPSRPVGRSASRADLAALLHEPPPEGPTPFAEVLRQFDERVCANVVRVQHPRFLAFVPSAPTPLSVLGDWLASSANLFSGVWDEAAAAAQVELTVLDWFRTILGMPEGASGLLTSGGSDANLTALVAARERLAENERGRAVLYVSEQRHWSIDRAAGVIGLLPGQVRPVAVDGGQRLSVAALRAAVDDDARAGRVPWVVAATAGTTNTGAVDPLPEVAALCRRRALWMHVDAAYGWAAALDGDELEGIGEADSVTLDPHKWLAQCFDVGALLVRDPAALERAFAIRPEYLEDVAPGEGEVNFADRGVALTRRFRALKVWLSLKVLGLGWHRGLVRHTKALAAYAAAALEAAGFAVVARHLSVVCFVRPGLDDAGHRALVERSRETGEVFASSTRRNGRVVLRLCFVNARTTADDVDRAVRALTC